MVKVIKKGIVKPEWPKKHNCKKCKSELEYAKKDVKDNYDPRDHSNDYWITCPVCKSQETVKHH